MLAAAFAFFFSQPTRLANGVRGLQNERTYERIQAFTFGRSRVDGSKQKSFISKGGTLRDYF